MHHSIPPQATTSVFDQNTLNPDTDAFEPLARAVAQQGLLAPSSAYYAYRIPTVFLLNLVGWVALANFNEHVHEFWIAIYLAFVFTQLSFFVHDAGHEQICRSSRVNRLLGMLHANLLLGMSYAWWLDSHGKHHAHPNQVDKDPDLSIPVLAFWDVQARDKRGWLRSIVERQSLLFVPMTLLQAVSKRRASIRFLLGQPPENLVTEASLIAVHYALYFGFVFYCLSPLRALGFVIAHQAAYGLFMAAVFAPNHMGMPILDEPVRLDYLARQVVTARNVKATILNDFWYGGANYQIEHHLFPRVSRNKLPRLRRIVKPYCSAHGVPYHETGFLRSQLEILRHLHQVSRSMRTA